MYFAVCNQFSRGVFAILGAISPESFVTLHSYSNTFQMPFLSSWYPEKVKCCFYKKCFFVSYMKSVFALSACGDEMFKFNVLLT